MEADLRNALERNELRLVFQPIVQLETGSVHAFEAPLRWHRPEHGVVLPAEFVPLAEQAGLILPIGAWVLQEACRHARRWQDAVPTSAPVRVSVNLSAKQLGHPASWTKFARPSGRRDSRPPAWPSRSARAYSWRASSRRPPCSLSCGSWVSSCTWTTSVPATLR